MWLNCRSRRPLVPSPTAPDTLQAVVESLADAGDRLAVLAFWPDREQRWSFAELAERARRLARGLTRAGIRRADPVGILAPNSPEWIIAALAIVDAGAVVVPLDAQASGERLGHLVHDSGSRVVFTTRALAARLEAVGEPCRAFLLDVDAEAAQSWERLVDGGDDEPATVTPDDRAALFYTAGTTGRPKGVPLTHANCTSNLRALLERRLVADGDRVLLPLPLHHVYPFMIGLIAPLACGATVVLPAALTGPQTVRALTEGEVTTIVGVPRFYEALVAGLQGRVRGRGRLAPRIFATALAVSVALRRRLGLRVGRWLFRAVRRPFAPRVRLLASGGGRLEPGLAWTLAGLGWDVAIGYGLTETAPLLTFTRPEQPRFETVGRPLPGVRIRIDRRGERADGEVLARGPNVFAGYHHLPEQTAAAFTDGWFRTGDLGRLDAGGYLHLTGRASDLIVLPGGENVMPEDVERRYAEDPVIRDIAVLERDGRLAAVVVAELREIRARAEDVDAAVRGALATRSRRLPSYQRVSEHVVTRESLPRTRLGKLRRHLLTDLYQRVRSGAAAEAGVPRPLSIEELAEDDRALLETPAAKAVWSWLVERYRDRSITPDTSPQLDLGIDSLEWLGLTLEMRERAGIVLTEDAIARVETVRDLLRESSTAVEGQAVPSAALLERPEDALSVEQRRWLAPTGLLHTMLGTGVFALTRAVVRRFFGLEVAGQDMLPQDRPLVFAPNHVSYLDPFVLAAALPLARLRRTYWGGWTALLFRHPVARAFSRAAHVVPVDPEQGVRTSLAFGAAVLARGQSLIWFPEGGRSPTGRLQRFRPGIGLLLERFPTAVVPVLIDGTYEALPPGRGWPRRVRLGVTFGRPLDTRQLAAQGAGEEVRDRIAHAVHDAVAGLARSSRPSARAA
jgi:long-chain acyl-CoA synthetase